VFQVVSWVFQLPALLAVLMARLVVFVALLVRFMALCIVLAPMLTIAILPVGLGGRTAAGSETKHQRRDACDGLHGQTSLQ
jgi:hypothetical protein